MKKTIWGRFLLLACALVFLVACQGDYQAETVGVMSKNDIKDCNLFINNMTCSDIHEVRTVVDEGYYDEVVSFLVRMKNFRPVISSDVILGKSPETSAIFESEEVRYTICFIDAEKQLSLDYVYREAPIVGIDKAEIDDYGNPHILWSWFCTMSAADYATAYEMIRTYSGGEIVER